MASSAREETLALIVRSRPYAQRTARAELDVALAAAAMDFAVEVYFVGPALMQLAAGRDGAAALLPVGYRGWAALPELTVVGIYAERDWLLRCERSAIRLLLPAKPLDPGAMRRAWRRCRHVLVV